MSQGEMHDEFFDKSIEAMVESLTPEQEAALDAIEQQQPGATSKLKSITGKVYSGIVGFMSGKGMSMYTSLSKEVALDEAERRFAEILQRVFWGYAEKFLGNIDMKLVQFFIRNPYGRAVTMAVIAVPMSGLLASRVEYFNEAGNIRYAKICLFLSRVTAKMALIDGMNAFSVDKLIDKAVSTVINLTAENGANIEEAIAQVSDRQVQEAAKNGKNLKKMHR